MPRVDKLKRHVVGAEALYVFANFKARLSLVYLETNIIKDTSMFFLWSIHIEIEH